MAGQSNAEEMDYGNFFDQIDDLIDFPSEDIGSGFCANDSNPFPNAWMIQSDAFPSSDSVYTANNNSDNSAELYVPFEEIVQMEWLSSFKDDSFSVGTETKTFSSNKKVDSSSTNTDSSSTSSNTSQFQSSSPVSVLDSRSSNMVQSLSPAKHGRPHTKRPRPTPTDEFDEEGEGKGKIFLCNRAESSLIIRIPKHVISEQKEKKKSKKNKISPVLEDLEENLNRKRVDSSQQPVRKCMHCEITKTPQWRLGPMGPKTLCNACGVRYKTGRLFPEYRPAASPTFVPSIHSNSHKKVVEMRSKIRDTETPGSDLLDLIPNRSNVAADYALKE